MAICCLQLSSFKIHVFPLPVLLCTETEIDAQWSQHGMDPIGFIQVRLDTRQITVTRFLMFSYL